MSNAETPRNRDRNKLIQSGYQGTAQPGANPLAVQQPELTETDIKRLERDVQDINTNIGNYTDLLDGLETALTPDGYLNFQPITNPPIGGGGVSFEEATIDTYVASTQSGTATLSSTSASISYINGTTFGLAVSDVVLVSDQNGTWVVIAVLSRPGAYVPPTYTVSPVTGFPADGLAISGNGIKMRFGNTGINRARICALYDQNGDLGLGLNVFVGVFYDAGTFQLSAYNPNTGVLTNIGFAITVNNHNWQVLRIGDTLYAKSLAAQSVIYAWRLSTGWTTITVALSDRMSTATISGNDYIVYSSAATTPDQWFYIDPSTLTEQSGGNLPTTGASATRIIAKGGYMWTDRGHVATSSFSPSWTHVHPTMNLTSAFDQLKVDVFESTGELVRIRQFVSTVTTWGIEFYSPTTSTVTQQSQLFTTTGNLADGEPSDDGQTIYPHIQAGNGVIAVLATIRADLINPANSTGDRVIAIWTTDGVTSARVIEENYTGTIPAVSRQIYGGIDLRGNILASNVGLSTAGNPSIYRTSQVRVDVV